MWVVAVTLVRWVVAKVGSSSSVGSSSNTGKVGSSSSVGSGSNTSKVGSGSNAVKVYWNGYWILEVIT